MGTHPVCRFYKHIPKPLQYYTKCSWFVAFHGTPLTIPCYCFTWCTDSNAGAANNLLNGCFRFSNVTVARVAPCCIYTRAFKKQSWELHLGHTCDRWCQKRQQLLLRPVSNQRQETWWTVLGNTTGDTPLITGGDIVIVIVIININININITINIIIQTSCCYLLMTRIAVVGGWWFQTFVALTIVFSFTGETFHENPVLPRNTLTERGQPTRIYMHIYIFIYTFLFYVFIYLFIFCLFIDLCIYLL